MSVKIIVAYDENRVIGTSGKIPWRIPEEIAHFKQATDNCVVIMGRVTWDGLPPRFRPLPNRINIVLSRDPFKLNKLVPFRTSLEEGLKLARDMSSPDGDIWIIGGSQIYRQALENNLVDEVVASEIFGTHEGDTFFPALPDSWKPTLLKEYNTFRVVSYKL